MSGKKTSFYMDEELLEKAKDAAWLQRKSFSKFLSDALKASLDQIAEKEGK